MALADGRCPRRPRGGWLLSANSAIRLEKPRRARRAKPATGSDDDDRRRDEGVVPGRNEPRGLTSKSRKARMKIEGAVALVTADVGAPVVHIMTNTALTGATYDIDGGQQLRSG